MQSTKGNKPLSQKQKNSLSQATKNQKPGPGNLGEHGKAGYKVSPQQQKTINAFNKAMKSGSKPLDKKTRDSLIHAYNNSVGIGIGERAKIGMDINYGLTAGIPNPVWDSASILFVGATELSTPADIAAAEAEWAALLPEIEQLFKPELIKFLQAYKDDNGIYLLPGQAEQIVDQWINGSDQSIKALFMNSKGYDLMIESTGNTVRDLQYQLLNSGKSPEETQRIVSAWSKQFEEASDFNPAIRAVLLNGLRRYNELSPTERSNLQAKKIAEIAAVDNIGTPTYEINQELGNQGMRYILTNNGFESYNSVLKHSDQALSYANNPDRTLEQAKQLLNQIPEGRQALADIQKNGISIQFTPAGTRDDRVAYWNADTKSLSLDDRLSPLDVAKTIVHENYHINEYQTKWDFTPINSLAESEYVTQSLDEEYASFNKELAADKALKNLQHTGKLDFGNDGKLPKNLSYWKDGSLYHAEQIGKRDYLSTHPNASEQEVTQAGEAAKKTWFMEDDRLQEDSYVSMFEQEWQTASDDFVRTQQKNGAGNPTANKKPTLPQNLRFESNKLGATGSRNATNKPKDALQKLFGTNLLK